MPTNADQRAFSEVGAPAAVAALAGRTVTHMVERVAAARVETWPFQHFYVEGIFPDDVYRQITANLPTRSSYLPFNAKRWKNDQGVSTRDRLYLSEGELERVDETRRPLRSSLTEALESDAFRCAVYEKLRADIAIRLGCPEHAVLEQVAYPNVTLIRDYQDYQIKPHPDGQPRVVTMQFYLPGDGTSEDLGTSLYTKLPLPYQLVGRKFKEIKRFPFRPNSAYAIAVNDCAERHSYHGRELITTGQTVRDSIIISWLSRKITLGQKHVA